MSRFWCLARRHAVTLLLVLMVAPGSVYADVASDFEALVEQGKAHLREGKLKASVARFRAAAALRPSPRLLMTAVSLYADIARQGSNPTAYCDETESSLENFFRDCGRCNDLAAPSCRLCVYVRPAATPIRLESKTEALADRFIQESQNLAENAAQRSGVERAKGLRRSEGFNGKAHDVIRCLGRLTVTSNPAGATIRVADKEVGLTPDTILFFAGNHTVSLEIPGRKIERKVIEVRGGQNSPLHISIIPTPGPVQTKGAVAQKSVVIQTVGPEGTRSVWPAVTFGLSVVLAGAGSYLLMDSQSENERLRKEVQSLSGNKDSPSRTPVTQDDKNRLQDDINETVSDNHRAVALISVAAIGMTVAGYWWYQTAYGNKNDVDESTFNFRFSPVSAHLELSF